jgi:hypothetical protein
MDRYVTLGALGQAALEALVAGAGIAVFFALGLRGLAMWTGDEVDGGPAALTARRNPAGLVLAVLCFGVVAAIVVIGLYVMLASK